MAAIVRQNEKGKYKSFNHSECASASPKRFHLIFKFGADPETHRMPNYAKKSPLIA